MCSSRYDFQTLASADDQPSTSLNTNGGSPDNSSGATTIVNSSESSLTANGLVEEVCGNRVNGVITAFRRNYVTDDGASCGSLNLSILFVGLLEVILAKIEPSADSRDRLLRDVLERLNRAEVFPNVSEIVEELRPLKKHYLKGFWNIIQEARTATKVLLPFGATQSSIIDFQTLSLPYPKNWFADFLHPSRYEDNFEEHEILGKGGFGIVYKARNRVDLAFYAVKKIFLKDFSHDNKLKILREARLIASLKHKNIVSYHTAWLEYVSKMPVSIVSSSNEVGSSETDSVSEKKESLSSLLQVKKQDQSHCIVSTDSEDGIIFEVPNDALDNAAEIDCKSVGSSNSRVVETLSESGNSSAVQIPLITIQDESDLSTFSRARNSPSFSRSFSCPNCLKDDKSSLVERSYLNASSKRSPSQELPGCFALFIQMQLYERNLKTWIVDRNLASDGSNMWKIVNHDQNVYILRQVLNAISHIHKKSIIHRDIKLENIFIEPQSLHVWLGDFGLARLAKEEESGNQAPEKPSDNGGGDVNVSAFSEAVGSPPYVAPELLNGRRVYGSEVDMFSFGVVMFELYRPFGTNMERSTVIAQLKKTGSVPDAELKSRWPGVCSCIERLTSTNPSLRPMADTLLS